MQIKISIILLFLFTGGLACKNGTGEKSAQDDSGTKAEMEFDKSKWSMNDGMDYPYRDKMLHDVVYNDTVRTLNKVEILNLLGEPDRVNENYLYYMIAQKRIAFWPLHTKTMVIKFTADDSVDWIKIHE